MQTRSIRRAAQRPALQAAILALVALSSGVGSAPAIAADSALKPAPAAKPDAIPAVDAVDAFRRKFAPGTDRISAYRIYTGADGHSKLETVTFVGKKQPFFDPENGLFNAKGVQVDKESVAFLSGRLAHINIYNAPADVDLPLHTSPGSEMFLILRGSSTLRLHDGTRQNFGPGDIVIFEDTTGKGRGGRIGPEGFTAINFSFVVQGPVGEEAKQAQR
jgi:hypothetical protein